MGKVMMVATVSVDGFIADEDDRVGALFDWYGNGPVATTLGDPDRVFHVSEVSAAYLSGLATVGAGVIGRRLFDLVDGWGGVPPAGEHAFVVTHEPPAHWPHPDAPFTFVTDGVASAIEQARAFAGGRDVSVTAGDVGGQAVAAGLVDEVHMNVAPVVLGSGIRFFGSLTGPVLLEDPRSVQGDRVRHDVYPVRRS